VPDHTTTQQTSRQYTWHTWSWPSVTIFKPNWSNFRESYNRTAAGRFIGLSIHCRQSDQVNWTPCPLTIFSGIRKTLSKHIKTVGIPPTEVSSFLFHQEWSCLEVHIVSLTSVKRYILDKLHIPSRPGYWAGWCNSNALDFYCEGAGSNFSCDTSYPNWDLARFSLVPPGKCRDSALIRPWLLPSICIQIHYSSIILQCSQRYWQQHTITHKPQGARIKHHQHICLYNMEISAMDKNSVHFMYHILLSNSSILAPASQKQTHRLHHTRSDNL
jgi:hypothetical protein